MDKASFEAVCCRFLRRLTLPSPSPSRRNGDIFSEFCHNVVLHFRTSRRQSSKDFCLNFLAVKVALQSAKSVSFRSSSPGSELLIHSLRRHMKCLGKSQFTLQMQLLARRNLIWQSTASRFSLPAWTPALSVKRSFYLCSTPLFQFLGNRHSEGYEERKNFRPVLAVRIAGGEKYGTVLSAQEFRDGPAMRYSKPLLQLPGLCDGCSCGKWISLESGLNIRRHNEIRDVTGQLASLAYGHVTTEPVVRSPGTGGSDDGGQVCDLAVRGVWNLQLTCYWTLRL